MSATELLMHHYPDIAFALTHSRFEPFQLLKSVDGLQNAERNSWSLHDVENIQEEVATWFDALPLDTIDTLYIYGIGMAHYFDMIRPWLEQNDRHLVIFIEEDIAVIDALVHSGRHILFEHNQVHVAFIFDWMERDHLLQQLAREFPSDKVAFSALVSYSVRHPRRTKAIELKIMRSCAAQYAYFQELLYSERLFVQIIANLPRLSHAFYANQLKNTFQKIPAIICGAGPSLTGSINYIKDLSSQALIIAGGSAITALTAHGITPHFCIALDPNRQELDRLHAMTAFEVPFLYANRLCPSIFSLCNGPFGYLRANTGGLIEEHLEEKLGIIGEPIGLDLGEEAFSVTTLAISYAVFLGCNPIILVGVDLAYTEKKRYASHVIGDNHIDIKALKRPTNPMDILLRRKDREGKNIFTTLKWVMEAACIDIYAKSQSEVTFINATEGGLGFKCIPYRPLQLIGEQLHSRQLDIGAWIHASLQPHFFDISSKQMQMELEVLQNSFSSCLQTLEQLVIVVRTFQETGYWPLGKVILLEDQIEQEPAYQLVVQPLSYVLRVHIDRHKKFQGDTLFSQPSGVSEKRIEFLDSIISTCRTYLQTLSCQKINMYKIDC